MKHFLFSIMALFTFTTNAQESIYDLSIKDIDGAIINLNDFKGKYILFVNVASECGFTPQYKGLEELHQKYKEKLVIIGLPCNQFGTQEPGNEEEIKQFCSVNFGVSFLLTEKVKVKGEEQHSIYKWLTNKKLNGKSNSTVKWNFQKYIVSPDGELINYFYSITKPLSTKITSILEQ